MTQIKQFKDIITASDWNNNTSNIEALRSEVADLRHYQETFAAQVAAALKSEQDKLNERRDTLPALAAACLAATATARSFSRRSFIGLGWVKK